MTVIQKKVCMLGATAVGKTSLVRRYVESLFSEKYQATIGVKIDRKLVEVPAGQVSLLLWDLQGEDDLTRVRMSYLRGASGLIFVADGTRLETIQTARGIQESAHETLGEVPSILLLNKADLTEQWQATDDFTVQHGPRNVQALRTSAKSGDNVETAFGQLVDLMIKG